MKWISDPKVIEKKQYSLTSMLHITYWDNMIFQTMLGKHLLPSLHDIVLKDKEFYCESSKKPKILGKNDSKFKLFKMTALEIMTLNNIPQLNLGEVL